MIELLKSVAAILMSPRHFHERLFQFRHLDDIDRVTAIDMGLVSSVFPSESGEINFLEKIKNKGIDLPMLVLLSWPFIILNSIYNLAGFQLSEWLVNNFFGEEETTLYINRVESGLSWDIFFMLVKVTLFPIAALLLVKVWEGIIQFFHSFLGKDEKDVEGISQVANSILLGNSLLFIPVFGPVLRFIASFIHLYMGLRYNLRYTRLQALIVAFSPIVLLGLVMAFFMAIVGLLIGQMIFEFGNLLS